MAGKKRTKTIETSQYSTKGKDYVLPYLAHDKSQAQLRTDIKNQIDNSDNWYYFCGKPQNDVAISDVLLIKHLIDVIYTERVSWIRNFLEISGARIYTVLSNLQMSDLDQYNALCLAIILSDYDCKNEMPKIISYINNITTIEYILARLPVYYDKTRTIFVNKLSSANPQSNCNTQTDATFMTEETVTESTILREESDVNPIKIKKHKKTNFKLSAEHKNAITVTYNDPNGWAYFCGDAGDVSDEKLLSHLELLLVDGRVTIIREFLVTSKRIMDILTKLSETNIDRYNILCLKILQGTYEYNKHIAFFIKTIRKQVTLEYLLSTLGLEYRAARALLKTHYDALYPSLIMPMTTTSYVSEVLGFAPEAIVEAPLVNDNNNNNVNTEEDTIDFDTVNKLIDAFEPTTNIDNSL